MEVSTGSGNSSRPYLGLGVGAGREMGCASDDDPRAGQHMRGMRQLQDTEQTRRRKFMKFDRRCNDKEET